MPNDNAIKLGILKCRDLVELYYGARMVTSLIEKAFVVSTTDFTEILSADPRRIKYEIIIDNQTSAAGFVELGTPAAANAGNYATYDFPAATSIVIERDFLTDFESVCLPVVALVSSNAIFIATRETFLTPIPVDEMP